KFIDDMGQKMAKVSHRPHLKFTFRIVDSPIINAFALPGGYVYFTRGILGYMNSEAEVAGVLGHEIGHVTARHGAKAYTRAQLAQVGFGVGMVFSEKFRQYSGFAQLGVGLLFMRFSRDHERQSDQLGVQYSTKIGYDATNMSHFFGTLTSLRQQAGGGGGGALDSWFSTHPDPEAREAKTFRLAKEAQKKSPSAVFRTEREPYLKLIDGIVFGEDPRQGFVEKGYFYHPTLDFQFPVPSEWQLVNTPQQVQMINKEKNAGIQFTLAEEASARRAADKFIASSKAEVKASDYRKTHGFRTEIRESTITGEQENLSVISYFIEKGQNVFVFHGFASTANYGKNLSAFKYTMNNFDRLRNQKARNVKPKRIKVVRVTRTTSLKNFLKRYPDDKVSAEELAIINGMKLTDSVRPGDRIKVLRK
ncbi:MAG: M48 family metalloprotease, partial [bacterium]